MKNIAWVAVWSLLCYGHHQVEQQYEKTLQIKPDCPSVAAVEDYYSEAQPSINLEK